MTPHRPPENRAPDAVESITSLGEPNRRRLYQLVSASDEPLSREAAANAAGISRDLAAFHLDRLVEAGLLTVEFARQGDRRGPGAGRPAKLYRRAEGELGVTLPPRAYERLAELLARALERLEPTAHDALGDVAREEGVFVGAAARLRAGSRPDHERLRDALLVVLEAGGFEPGIEPGSGDIRTRNCPYRALSEAHRTLTCGLNVAWAQGVVAGLDDERLQADLAPSPGACCVVIREAPEPTGS